MTPRPPQPITSRDNPGYKRLRALAQDARARQHEGATVLDGAHLLRACLEAGHTPESVWLSETGAHNPEIVVTLRTAPDVPTFVLPDALIKAAAPTDTPTGVLAIYAPQLPVAAPSVSGIVLVLEGVQDAGNVGSILRTAAAAGVGQAWLTPGCAKAWSPKVLRAGMGAHFAITIHDNVNALKALADAQANILATSLNGTHSLFDVALETPVVWLFGAEGAGLSEALAARATHRVKIPMPGRVESLNVAAAAAVCLFEQVRRKG